MSSGGGHFVFGADPICFGGGVTLSCVHYILITRAWVKVFKINPEFRILRLSFHRKSASKC